MEAQNISNVHKSMMEVYFLVYDKEDDVLKQDMMNMNYLAVEHTSDNIEWLCKIAQTINTNKSLSYVDVFNIIYDGNSIWEQSDEYINPMFTSS